jgi:flagellin-like protein
MYDVTNEIEFQYDSGCKASYDYATVGYQDTARTQGETLRAAKGYLSGAPNPHSVNYRIATDSNGHSSETFTLGMTELPTFDTVISGVSDSQASTYRGYACYDMRTYTSSANWYNNAAIRAKCNANIDMPDDFTFEYFGTEYNGSDSKNRVHISRFGNMYFKSDGVTGLENSLYATNAMPTLPDKGSRTSPGMIAPWWGYYSSYYCYDNTALDCSVRTRVIPFEGKGTDQTSDITSDTTWGLIDSPIRINPSSTSGYLTVSADLTIEPGVVIQVAPGKGISFDGACDSFTAEGNSTDHILIEGSQGATWKGLAFTGACAATDERHTLSYVDFANTTDAAIAAGSRHGTAPISNANVGNFTMDHVTFTNVETAFEHGSGAGTVVTMTDFEVNDASGWCFDFAENSEVTLSSGSMNGCDLGAIHNVRPSPGGSLILENIDIVDAKGDLLDVEFDSVWISNVSATLSSGTTLTSANAGLTSAGKGATSSFYAYNFSAPDYGTFTVWALESVDMEDIDLGTATVNIYPGGTSSSAAGPSGSGASIVNLEAGNVNLVRISPSLDNLTIGLLTMMGNSPSSDMMIGKNWNTTGFTIGAAGASGCGYNIHVTTLVTNGGAISGSCSNSASINNVVIDGVTATYTGSTNAIYARNTAITIGDGSVTMPTTFDEMAKASTGGRIVLIDVTQDGTDCESSSDCNVSSSSAGVIYFGGIATVKAYKSLGAGVKEYKEGHTVQATAVDAGAILFPYIGTHKTDANGEASVWVLTQNDLGDTYTNHNLVAYGPSGQNETLVTDSWYPGSFEVGDSIELRLEPAPVSLNGTNMDCDYLKNNNPAAALGYDGTIASGGTNTFTWEGKVTMVGDLNIDDCNVVMKSVFRVQSDATISPKLTISSGGSLTFSTTSTDVGTLKATSSAYPLDLDIAGGTLALDGGKIFDVKGGIVLDSGTMIVENSAVIYGNAQAPANVATVYVNGGSLVWDDSTIQNSGQTGIGLMFEDSDAGDINNIVVRNAAVGIYSHNAAPEVNGFTLNGNDIGVDVYGGMTLDTIYRSPLLQGMSRGWHTYEIDVTAFAGDADYVQIGYESIYEGGNAHPRYTSRYYMITDRYNVQLSSASSSWNVTSVTTDGYYDGALGGGSDNVGIPSHNCNTYGYSYNPGYWDYSYNKPTGFDWEDTPKSANSYYPMHYWGQRTGYSWSPTYFGFTGPLAPIDALSSSGYNVCMDYASSYSNSPGDSMFHSMPIVDVSGSNITAVKMYIDVMHNRADNYQDRIEFQVRSGDDPSDLGAYVREAGTPSFNDGVITGAKNGLEVGGRMTAVSFDNVTVTNPTNAGLEVTGSTVSTISNLTVDGGSYGALLGAGASGTVDLTDVAISGSSTAGIYYLKNVEGLLTGSIGSSSGPGIKFGKATTQGVNYTGMALSTNAVGIENAGKGLLNIIDSTFANTKDVVISGEGSVNFVEGSVDSTSVDVTGTGLYSRMRQLDIQVDAGGSGVSGANVILKDGSGTPTGSAVTDATGEAADLRFVTETVSAAGYVLESLAGYEAVTVAKVGTYSYTNPSVNSGDFRYAFDAVTLADTSGNTHSMNLVNTVDARVCYSYSTTSFEYIQNCPGLSTSGSRTYNTGMVEYGYYGATPRDMSGDVIMADSGYWYLDGNTDNSFNESTVIVTATYNSYESMTMWSTSPYGAKLYAHNSEWVSIATDDGGAPQGIFFGQNGRSSIIPDIQNSTISGLASIATNYGYKSSWSSYIWDTSLNVQNNVLTHFRSTENTGSAYYHDMCLNVGSQNVTIAHNVLTGCGVGVFVTRTPYTYYHAQSLWGADDAIIHNNTFKDTSQIDVWFYLNSYSEGVEITNNTMSGTTAPSYGVYTQDRTTTDLLIKGNTISNSDEAIYMRGARDWNIMDNTIFGKGDASKAGIFVKDGYGVIDGNTLTDADGGILVDGIQTGFNANITNNDLSQTSGRVAPAAIGIWVEDCGSSIVNTGGNTVSIMENAIVTDGCDLVDSGSTLEAIGGSGGSVYTVQMNAAAFVPANLSINEGDTVRWRANEYYTDGVPHDVTSNATDAGGAPIWSSGGGMNLGSTYTKSFSTAGTYDYYCSVHSFMYGSITVTTGTGGGFASVGINVVGTGDEITLDGTSVSGFETAIEQFGGSMTLSGDAILSGDTYAAYAEDTDVIVDGAELIASSTGTAMYVTGTSSFDATDMSTSGLYGLNTDAVDFRWNGGDSDAVTSLMAESGAQGSVENVTWADTTTQINAGSYVTVTSVGNTLDAAKLVVDSTAVVHEGNLLDLSITHKGGTASDVGLLIQSTDGAQAAYVSPAYRAPFMLADGDLSEWYGNVKNPSDDAMPGVMSSDNAGEDFLATWDATNLYLALTGVDMGAADLQIYIDSSTGGDTSGDAWPISHALPFAADYVFWAEDDSTANSGLKVSGLTGWSDVTSSCGNMLSTIGNSGDTDTEISIPWDCIGQPSATVRMIVIVQDETTGAIESVHPDQTFATGAVGQTFSDELTILMGHGDLVDGDDLTNHLLIYRSYVGSNTPSDAKTYDISVKVDAACQEDWGNINSVDMSTNVAESVNILRACPVIQDLVDITVNEDSGAYTLTMLDKVDDVQDLEETLIWTVADDSDPSRSPTMLLDSSLSSVAATGQIMTITPDNDQFGEYVFHFTVEDSHGLTAAQTITFTVVNVNDAPIICNEERADCMPVFADDGDGNLNVLDEGFGSVSKVLGSAANATGSYVVDMASNDMANEQPQVYSWNAQIKGDDVTVDPYWVQKKYDTVAEMFAEVGAAVTSQGGFQDLPMTGDPASISPNGTYTLPTLNNVSLLTYLLAQNGCGTVWYQEYMDASGNKITAVRSDDGCDSTIDANAMVYNSLNYSDFWLEAYGVDVDSFTSTWSSIFPTGYTTTGGYNPCPAFSVSVVNNELSIVENAANELGGECTIVLSLSDDGGYCANSYLGRTTDVRASCVSYTWLIDYDVVHPVYGPMTVTGCYNLYLGLASFIPEYLAPGVPSGMTEDICLAYSWNGENTDAVDYEVNFSVTPVNDAPEVLDWDRQAGVVISDGNGEVPSFPWKVTLTEDDENVNNLTYDLSAMKDDNDHEDADLEWTIVKSDTCNYENYFSATINGDDIAFDLIKDATTNAPEWEVDYLKNSGIHQKNPLSGEFCPITLYLRDTATAPSYVPNYGMTTANYQQGEDSVTLYVRVDNVAENVPDYFLSDVSGFDFNEISNIMPKTFVPTTVTIGHGGDTGPYNYDHMLEVTFHSNGYNSADETEEGYVNLGTQYVMPPAYGETIEVTDFVYITATSKRVWVEVDVLTCVAESCDMSASPEDRFFGYSFPYAHRSVDSNGEQSYAWSSPGEVGTSSVDADGNPSAVTLNNKRRPMLEDQDWCNNLMSNDLNGSDCAQPRTFGETTIGTGQNLPTVVRLIGTADVPSFAPSIIAISAAGLFVSALVLQSRRDEEEESLEEMILEADEQAVSPVIATILMVAITVVLSGVIYVWASSLADTSAKGVPRMTFDVDSDNGEFHRITVTASQVELATQAMVVTIEYTDSTGEIINGAYNLAETTVYGFYPGNSPSMVTFGDAVGGENGAVKSSFDTGDTIYVKTIDENGEPIGDMYISISYVPNTGPGSVLRTWDSL